MIKRVFILSLILGFAACQQEKNENKLVQTSKSIHIESNKPTKKLNVAFLAINGVYNSELMAPYDIFQHTIFHTDLGMETFIVAPSEEVITTFEGIRILPDYTFDNAPEIDVLIVPSAEHNMDSDLEDERLINFVKEKGTKAQVIMSLCDGAFILAQAGLLNGLKCTTFPTDIDKFKATFTHLDVYKEVSFVHDGKAITSSGGAKSYDPALYLVEYLYGKKVADGVAAGLVFDWDVNEVRHLIGN
jgi:transcriptional regulator GlxA family with amidase domain